MAIVTRTAGTCPICTGVFKVRSNVLVHHGFKRPGVGYIIGDCFAVGWQPYELSADVCRQYLKKLAELRAARMNHISDLSNNPPDTVSESGGFKRTITYKRGEHGYDRVLQATIRKLQYDIKEIDRDTTRTLALIRDWKKAPLLEIDEQGRTAETREATAKRSADRASAKDAKLAKRRELDKKTVARENAKTSTIRRFHRMLSALAALPPSKDRTLQAQRLNAEMQKKKYKVELWDIADFKNRALDDMIELGIATRGAYAPEFKRYLTAAGAPVIPQPKRKVQAVLGKGKYPIIRSILKG